MLYAAADYELIGDPSIPFAENFAANDKVHTLLLQDNYNKKTKFWYVKPDSSLKLVEDSVEYNMGDEATLAHYISTSKKKYPADRYILCFYSHGGGWMGCCGDETDNDLLTNDNIKEGLKAAAGVDIIMFTAPCLMGSIEMAYELKDQADYIIASENTSSYFRWFGPMDNLNLTLLNNPKIDSKELSINIIDWILQYKDELYGMFDQFDFGDDSFTYDKFVDYLEKLTMSVVETDKVEILTSALHDLSLVYAEDIDHFDSLYTSIYDSLESYNTVISDLLSLVDQMRKKELNSTTVAKWNYLETALNNAIIANCHGDSLEYAGGLNIYCPNPATENYTNYYSGSYYGLDLSTDCYYAQLLNEMFEYKSGLAKTSLYRHDDFQKNIEIGIQLDQAFIRGLKKKK